MIGQLALFKPKGKRLRNRIEITPITVAQARYTLENLHYLKRCRTGRQINYAVLIDGIVDGVITYAYPLMSAGLCDVPADELLEFSRLYLKSNIPHSASCAVGRSLRCIVLDWAVKFPDAKPIRLIVSWSDTTRHQGTIYKAANFQWLKISKGAAEGENGIRYRPDGRKRRLILHPDRKNPKDCWIYKPR